jgi:signal transduction histidine kinase
MESKPKRSIILGWLLSVPTIILLLFAPPEFTEETFFLGVIFAGLIVFTLNTGLAFSEGEISTSYTVGIMALLTLGKADDLSVPLWSVAIGAVVGTIIRETSRLRWTNWRTAIRMTWEPALRTAGELTIGLAVSGWVYQLLDGQLPLREFNLDVLLPVLGLIFSYLSVYLAVVLLKTRLEGTNLLVEDYMLLNWQSLIAVLLGPLPLAMLGSVIYHNVSTVAFLLLIASLAMLTSGIYSLSVTEYRSKQQVRELRTLTAVSTAMQSNLDSHTLLQTIYLQVAHLLDIENFTVVMQNPTNQQLDYMVNIRRGQEQATGTRYDEQLIKTVIETKAPLRISRDFPGAAKQAGIVVPLGENVQSWLGVPLITTDRVSGAIVIYSDNKQRQFSRSDQRLLATVATQASIAIDNAQLYEQAHRRVHQLRALTEASTRLTSTLEFQEILTQIGTLAETVMDASASALYMWWDDAKQLLALVSSNGFSDNFNADPPIPLVTETNKLETQHQPIHISDSWKAPQAEALRPVLDKEGKRAWTEVLMRDAEEVLGVLVVYYDEPHSHSDEDIEVLRTFASQAALAIRNAQRYGKAGAALNRRMEQILCLQQLSQELYTSRIQLEQIYERVLNMAIEGTGANAAALILRLDTSQPAHRVHTVGYHPEVLAKTEPVSGITGHVFETADAVIVPDVHADKKYKNLRAETVSQLSVPILRDTETIGVITLESNSPQGFVSDDKYFVMQIGSQAQAAIENYNLVNNIETTRDRLQIILDSMTEAVILVNAQGFIRLANPRASDLLDLDPALITDCSLAELMNEPQLKFAEKLGFEPNVMRGLVVGLINRSWQPETRRTTYDYTFNGNTHRFISRFDIAVQSQEGRIIGWLMVFSDVTEERELARAREDLSSMIIHDLRGPLTAINASLKLIDTVGGNQEGTGKIIKQTTGSAGRAVRKLLNLVNSLLDVSKMENDRLVLQREPGDIYQIADAVITELRPLAEEMDIHIVNQMDDDIPLLDIDGEKVERILLNLVDNAIKFTPSEGEVTIRANLEENNGPAPRYIKIQVIDTGPGIPEEYRKNLFDRYVTIKGQTGRRRGTGLGLTFCHLAVEAHDGRIWIEDNPQGGSIFAFTLPVANQGR